MGNSKIGLVLDQVKNTLLVTLWVFIAIEGATVVSARTERRSDIGTATMLGFGVCLAICALVSLLSLGILGQPELAGTRRSDTSVRRSSNGWPN